MFSIWCLQCICPSLRHESTEKKDKMRVCLELWEFGLLELRSCCECPPSEDLVSTPVHHRLLLSSTAAPDLSSCSVHGILAGCTCWSTRSLDIPFHVDVGSWHQQQQGVAAEAVLSTSSRGLGRQCHLLGALFPMLVQLPLPVRDARIAMADPALHGLSNNWSGLS